MNIRPVIFLLFLAACTSQGAPKTEVRDQLIGEWRNTYIKVTMPTYLNSDTSSILEVSESEWEQKLKGRVIRTFFRADGSYNSEHRDLKDSIFYNPAGRWSIRNDSLIMRDTFPQPAMYKMKLTVKGNMAEFTGLLDFDGDGKEDDLYYGKQRKQ